MGALRRLGLLLAVALAALGGTAVTRAASRGAPSVVADSGFRSPSNGYAFPNYGAPPGGLPNLGSDEMRELFGNEVCAGFSGETCVLSPSALAWMQEQNSAMATGHCFGFSVSALLFWAGLSTPSPFGAATVPGLKIAGNQLLAREIAYAYAYQQLQSVVGAEVSSSPSAVIETLTSGLGPTGQLYTLGVINASGGGGHAITPVAVQRLAANQYAILVYDNNFPGQTRKVMVNTKTNKWSYVAAVNPRAPDSLYTGNAATHSLLLLPARPGVGVQPCPFCAPAGEATTASVASLRGTRARAAGARGGGTPFETIRLQSSGAGGAHLLIRDPRGRRIGFVHGHLIDQIPGGRIVRVFVGGPHTWLDRIEPEYEVPTGNRYRLELGTASARTARHTRPAPAEQSVTVLEPGFVAAARGIAMTPGQHAELGLSSDGHTLSFVRARGGEEPELVLGNAQPGANDYQWNIRGRSRSTGTVLTASLDLARRIMSLTGEGTYDLSMDLIHNSVSVFTRRHVRLRKGATARFSYGSWAAGQSMPFTEFSADHPVTRTELGDERSAETGSEFAPIEPTPLPAPQPSGKAGNAGYQVEAAPALTPAPTPAAPNGVQVPRPEFMVERLQRRAGSPEEFKTGKLEGAAPLTAEYEILVNNTGSSPVTVESVSDPGAPACDTRSPKQPVVAPGQKAVEVTCTQTIIGEGELFADSATVTASGEQQPTNQVQAETPRFFEIVTEQKRGGQPESDFTRNEIFALLAQVIDYRIKVTNTSTGTLRLSPLTDEYCKGVSPTGEELLEPGTTATFNCYDAPGEDELLEGHFWINEATITGTDEAGESETKTSNRVIVDP